MASERPVSVLASIIAVQPAIRSSLVTLRALQASAGVPCAMAGWRGTAAVRRAYGNDND